MGLIYVDIGNRGKSVRAMIDNSTTYNFMVDIDVRGLGFTVVKD